MPTTTYYDPTFGVREIGARTDSAGTAVDDLPLEQDALVNAILTGGFLTSGAFQVAADSPASMDLIVGSGTAKADLYVVETDETGRHPYIVRLDDANDTITVDAADASNPRIDEIWLVVRDPGLSGDAGSLALPRLAYRKGDAAASPASPGADSAWAASVRLATISVGAGVTSIGSGDITDNRAAATVAVPNLLGSVEVDGSTEDASATLSGSYATIATVNLTIPTGWNTWRCEAYATTTTGLSASGAGVTSVRVSIDGTAQQALEVSSGTPSTGQIPVALPMAVGGRRTGMSTTGSRSVTFEAKTTAGVSLQDTYLYARAVRTS